MRAIITTDLPVTLTKMRRIKVQTGTYKTIYGLVAIQNEIIARKMSYGIRNKNVHKLAVEKFCAKWDFPFRVKVDCLNSTEYSDGVHVGRPNVVGGYLDNGFAWVFLS